MELKYHKFTLPNGLNVILSENHTLPTAAVNIWYHVGSKNEQFRKTGFAHLFEHIMFEGSKNHEAGFFQAIEKLGASLNGSTNSDRTNYWENFPSNYLEYILWLESDRMGYLLEAFDQKKFDVEKDVVKNERRQSYENRPYGRSHLVLQELIYPSPHPYHWPTIGYHEDLDSANLDDVKDFFKKYYVPANASLSIVGDIQIDKVQKLVYKYFGEMPKIDKPEKLKTYPVKLPGNIEMSIYDKITLPAIQLAYPTVEKFNGDEAILDLLSIILGDGESSRLHKSLVIRDQVAIDLSVYHDSNEIAGDFKIDAVASDSIDIDYLINKLELEFINIANDPFTLEELERAKNRITTGRARRLSRNGGFGGRADLLNLYNVYQSNPGLINTDNSRYTAITLEQLSDVYNKYIYNSNHVALKTLPQPETSNISIEIPQIDRTIPPNSDEPLEYTPDLPDITTLPNGIKLVFQKKLDNELVSFKLLTRDGASNDPEKISGLTNLTTDLLATGTTTRTISDIANDFEYIGSHLNYITGRQTTVLESESLKSLWGTGLEIIGDIYENPTFPQSEIERKVKEQITEISTIKDSPDTLARIIFPQLIYGDKSKFGHPLLGTIEDLSSISQDNISSYHNQRTLESETFLIVTGNTTMEEIEKHTNNSFKNSYNKQIKQPSTNHDFLPLPSFNLVDIQGAPQTVIRIGFPWKGRKDNQYYAASVLNQILGGQFTSRINTNLRQDKGYTYGFHSWFDWSTKHSIYTTGGSVQTSTTVASLHEIFKEIEEIKTTRIPDKEEFEEAKSSLIRQFPSAFESNSSVNSLLTNLPLYDLDNTYYQNHCMNIEKVTLDEIIEVSKTLLNMESMIVLVVGDKSIIMTDMHKLDVEFQDITKRYI
jgi:predicted Zn-dependent peptidase